jgi:hypothetical protein
MKTGHLTVFAICVSLSISSCENTTQNQKSAIKEDSRIIVNEIDTLKLINNKCFSCHNPDMEIDNRLAPPFFKVREHYLSDSITKVEFVNAIWKFVQNPSEELSIMPGAVRNFSLMPKQNFKEEDVKIIASYLFENDISNDNWYNKWDSLNKKIK